MNLHLISFQQSQLFSKHFLVVIQNIVWRTTLHLVKSLQIQLDMHAVLHTAPQPQAFQVHSTILLNRCSIMSCTPAAACQDNTPGTYSQIPVIQLLLYPTPLRGVFRPEPPPLLPVYYTLHLTNNIGGTHNEWSPVPSQAPGQLSNHCLSVTLLVHPLWFPAGLPNVPHPGA